MGNFLFTCPICGNSDIKYVGFKHGTPYCRKCITFKGENNNNYIKEKKSANYELTYSLSKEQFAISSKLVDTFKHKKNSFVYAVCGSGKTEIVIEVIKYCIEVGYHVGFAVPRKDVVIELSHRFKDIFKNNKITAIYGDCHKDLDGDLICLTTHQLYRFRNFFDLLILDEIDAFPFKNNKVLHSFFEKSIKGNYILMSATPSKKELQNFKKSGGNVYQLFYRYHRKPLPVPEIILGKSYILFFKLCKTIKEILKVNKPLFIFVPTIDICESLFNKLKIFFKNGNYVHSKCSNRNEIIKNFRKGKYKFLITTAVLERGVTINNVQVIIYQADHKIYDRYSLIQISGRVGRKKENPYGKVYYFASNINKEMEESINEIKRANSYL